MRPVNPAKGIASARRVRGSQEALLARGIAAPRRTSRLPMIVRTRTLITQSPRAIRLGRIGGHVRGKWLALSAIFLASALIYGAVIGGQTERAYDALLSGMNRLAVAAGFGVQRITVNGKFHTTDAAITAALGAGPDTMMLSFDTDAAKTRLEAVPWIRRAQVMRLLPSTLQVMIEERSPYAVWQSKGRTYVVDAEGVVLAPALRDAYPDLPFVVGEGAAKHAAELFDELTLHAELQRNMLAAIRVGDRRWTLKLLSGVEIMLPDDNIAEALASLERLERERGLLQRDVAAVDLRLLDRVTVRLRPGAATTPLETAPQTEVPTASTDTNKGKT